MDDASRLNFSCSLVFEVKSCYEIITFFRVVDLFIS